MTTPDPITTARRKTIEMSEELYEFYPAMSAQNHADEVRKYVAQVTAPLLAELEKLKAERDEALTAHEDRGFDCERLRQDNARLTSQLEQAEKVIKPIGELYTETLAISGDDTVGDYMGVNVRVRFIRAASQWIKDRQDTGEG